MTAWVIVVALCVGTALMKAAGPVALGSGRPSLRLGAVIGLLAPALLAGLVMYETVHTGNRGLTLDSRAVGVGAAAVALALRLPLVAVIASAAVAAAVTRALL